MISLVLAAEAREQMKIAMTETDGSGAILRRMVAGGGDNANPPARPVLRALRMGFARAASDALDLALSVIGITQGTCRHEDLGTQLPTERLMILLDGPGSATGALLMDGSALAALVQQQTMGRVAAAPAPTAPRAFTETDAALAAPLIDAVLAQVSTLCESVEDRALFEGVRFGARVHDLHGLLVALESGPYRLFDLTLDFAGGERQGAVLLVLPAPEPERDATSGEGGEPGLAAMFGVVRAELLASVGRIRLPLCDLAAMKAGDLLPLRGKTLREVELRAIDGNARAAGRLGQVRGMRAVRLESLAPVGAENEPFAERLLERGPQGMSDRPVAEAMAAAAMEQAMAGDAVTGGADAARMAKPLPDADLDPAEITALAGLDEEDESSDEPVTAGRRSTG